jgi:acyl-coenzyme A synthetase/AMP-(fatty) acid ligase/acyl carrier protein
VLNHYGPTEATVGCCAYAVDWSARPADAATVPIGHPLAGDQVHVLDHGLEPVPAGVPGELCIGGAGLAQGYVGRPEETAERFVTGSDGGRLYRTGDRVRRLRDGAIEFLGRLDDQVKIRGHRIEPGEVEGVLLRQPGVRQAAVMARAADEGAPRLVAYLVAAGAATDDALRAALEQVLPEHMIPSAFVRLDALPFTASGKVDRRALPEPEAAQSGTAFVAPRDALEEEIAGIWSELLKVDKVGVEDDFFALGGHSLLATQVIMAIRRRYGDIPLRALLAAPTVAALADAIRRS